MEGPSKLINMVKISSAKASALQLIPRILFDRVLKSIVFDSSVLIDGCFSIGGLKFLFGHAGASEPLIVLTNHSMLFKK